MKKKNFQFFAMLMLAVLVTFSACKKDDDDDDNTPAPAPEYTVLQGNITANQTLDAAKKYLIDGFVFVEDGVTLTIEAGTLLEGNPGQGENASALIVKMGGTLIANGTANEPIIMTGLGDGKDGAYLPDIRGLWGGLIMLGKATTNNTIAKRIEGVPEQYNAFYGFDANNGADDNDNSGSVQYVCLRHGGTDIGAGNEINGLTLGAVGKGTTFNYIEVMANKDDGVEFFGGAAQMKHVFVAWVGDDSFDYDEGFHGKGQFCVALQAEDAGDRCAEQDGGTGDDEAAAPYAQPTFFNTTYIGNGNKLMVFRDNAAGIYANAIFHNTGKGVNIEYRDDKHSSLEWLLDASPAATLKVQNSLFSKIADEDVASSVVAYAESGSLPAGYETALADMFNNNANAIEEVTFQANGIVPTGASTQPVAAPTDPFFETAAYHGAFQPGGSNWAQGWTLLFK